MKKTLLCFLTILLFITGCLKKEETIKPSEVVYWGIDDGILYLSPTRQGYAINKNISLLEVDDWEDRYSIPWFEQVEHEIYGIEILNDNGKKIVPLSTAYWFYGCVHCEYIHGLENLDTRFTKNMNSMFHGLLVLKELDLSSLNTSNVVNMRAMFCGSGFTSLDLSTFNTINVDNMSYMFCSCRNLTNIDLYSFNTSNVTDMSYMFDECNKLEHINISSFDTSNVQFFNWMFFNTRLNNENIDVSNFDISKAVDIDDISDLFGFHM